MSFSAYARQVRDPALPHRRRVSALRSCVQLYRPIGFQATLSFLSELAGPFEQDETAMLRALDALMTSRAVRRVEIDRYAAARTAAKRRGQRVPHRDEPNPHQWQGYWYGAPRQAALHALTHWRHRRLPELATSDDPTVSQLNSCITACLTAGGPLTPADRRLLTTAVDALRAHLRSSSRLADVRVWDLLQVARIVQIAADPEPSIDDGSPETQA